MDDVIETQIESTVAQSPVQRKQEAEKKIKAQDATVETTHLTGEPSVNDVEQVQTKPESGVEFTEDTTDVYSGGIAVPKSKYNTRRQAADTTGNPLYFEPNYQEVVPFDVATAEGSVKSTTLDPEKLAWQIATSVAGKSDDRYYGYKELPYAGTLGWWSHAAGGVKNAIHNLIPEAIKGGAAMTLGAYAAGLRGVANLSTALGADEKDIENIVFGAEQLQALQDTIDKSMNWAEREYGTKLIADLEDQSLSAKSARGISSGLVNVGAALLTKNPSFVFSLLNFAGQNEMRQNALKAGVSPVWADIYSLGGAGLNTALDLFQFSAVTGGFALTRKAVYEQIAKEGLYKFHLGRALARNAVDMFVIEPGTEMIQESIEGAYDDDFIQDPADRLFVAAVSAMALKAVMLPTALRHAKQEERLAMAQALGVEVQYLSVFNEAKNRINQWVSEGKLDAKQGGQLLELIISRAPDAIIKEIRDGTLGQLDKVSAEERTQFAQALKRVNKSAITEKAFNELDQRVDDNLKTVALPDSQKTMIKGIVRGLAQLKLLQDGTAPADIQIPNFVVSPRKKGSEYNATTNTITISSMWSDVDYTKTRDGNSSEFNTEIRSGFMPSSAQSDRMSSIIHELGHWIDYQMGEKGFGDFLEHYYNNIAEVFGNDRALAVYNASKQGADRGLNDSRKTYTSNKNATEWNAQSLSRLGKRAAEQLGLGNSQAQRFLSYANLMFNQMAMWTDPKQAKETANILGGWQTAIQDATKQNMDVLQDLIDTFGDNEIKAALKNFLNDTENPNEDFAEYLARHDMLKKLFDVMDTFADATGIEKINDLFDSKEEMQSFVDKGDMYFRTGYDNAVAEIKEKRAERAAKEAQKSGEIPEPKQAKNNGKQVQLQNGTTATLLPNGGLVGPDGIPNFGGDGGIDAVRALLRPEEGTENERYWSTARYHFEGGLKISEQSEDVQNAVKKLADKYLFGPDGFALPETEALDIGEPTDVLDLKGDELVDLLNKINEMDLGLTKKQLGSYGLGYWGDYLDSETYGLEADYIPNDYTAGTDPVAEVRQAYEQGASGPVDEVPSYDKEVDGRKLGEDIESLTKGIAARAKALPNKIVKWAASSPWGWGLDRIITTMFGREASNKLDIAGKYTRRNALRSGMYGKFMQELAPIIGDVTKDKTAAMFKYKTMLNNLGFVRVKGVEINDPYNSDITTTRDLTGWEVMYVYLMQRMGTKYGNRIQQSTKTNINELIATLSDEEKQFADAMSKTLRDVWVGIVGEDKAVVNYFPILSATHAVLDEVNIDTFKQRMETDDPIAIDDAGRIFSKDISRLASWQSGYYQTLKRLREVLQYKGAEGRNIDPAVDEQMYKASALLAGQVSNVFGRDAYHNVLRLLDTQIADPQDQMLDSASSKTLQQMGNNVIKSMLSFKFMSLPKNLANITMMWGGAQDQSTYWNGFAEGIGDMKRTWEYMMKHSNEIRMRYNDAGYNEFLDQRNTGGSTAPIFKGISKLFAGLDWTGDKTGGMAKMSAALDMMGDAGLKMFMLNGDAVANIYGGYGLIKDYMKQGMSEADAFKKLDRYIVEHQSSSNLAMKPLGQLQANKSLAGQVMAFTSEGVAKWASILGTFDEVKMGTATKSEAIANAMSIAMSMLLFTALSAGIWDLWDDDEKVQEEAVKSLEGAMIDQLFGGSVLGNGFLTPAVQGMLGLGGNMGISAPLWSFMTEGVGNLKKGEYDRIITKAMEATGALVGANALYNDIQGIMFMTSPDADIREAGFRMLGGRTPGYAEKRTGAKIRKSSKENVENSDEE